MKFQKPLKDAKKIVQDSLKAFGISQEMKTNPKIIKETLKELHLDDFNPSFLPMKKFLKEIQTTPKKLKPLFLNIEKGLTTKHPAIIEFLELALQKKWFKKSQRGIKSIHIMFILEAMSATMCNNHQFLIQAEDHYRSKTKRLGLDNKHIIKTTVNTIGRFHDFFKVAKILALDPIMIYFRLQKGLGKSLLKVSQLKNLHKTKKINYFEYKLLYKLCNKCSEPANELVQINIFEAGISEYKNGFHHNALSAYVLAQDLKVNSPPAEFKKEKVVPENNSDNFYNHITKKNNIFLNIDANQEWVSLYISWNMAFILGNLENLDLLFPKLFMPSIINAKNDAFLGVRVISLWLSINHFLFRTAKKEKVEGPEGHREMAQAWSKINVKYAFHLAKSQSKKDPYTIMRGYDSFFIHPFYQLLRIIKSFFTKKCT